ncbi:MAG: alpha-glucosidase, partial [Thaumarchaeota archaeon]
MIEFVAKNIIRIFRDGKEETPALIKERIEEVSFQKKETEDFIEYDNGFLKVKVNKQGLVLIEKDGEIIFEEVSFERMKKGEFVWTHKLPDDAKIYGFGEKGGPLNKRGWRKFKLMNRDPAIKYANPDTDPLYLNVPFYIIAVPKKFVLGVFINSSYYMKIDPGKGNKRLMRIEAEGGNLDVFIIFANDVKEVLYYYTELTGRTPMPPLWSLGYHQSKWSYMSEEEVMNVAKKFRELDIPCDVIHLDIDYMDGYRVFTWNTNRFPDPAKMIKKLHEMGFKVVVIQDPYVKADETYWLYREGLEKDYFVKDRRGYVFYERGWPGKSAFPDFTKEDVRKWWGRQYVEFHKKYGVDGYWNDMNEPSFVRLIPLPRVSPSRKMVFYDNGRKTGIEKNGNIYGLLENMATIEELRKAFPNKRFFLLSRAGFAGLQRYSATWTGDVWSSWKHLRRSITMILGLGLSGIPFVGADIGGFAPPRKANWKLYVRWLQLGVFYPFMRGHYMKGKPPQEPWAFNETVTKIAREYIKLRYRLLPYIYSLFWESHKTGLPLMRPLFMEFPDDEKAYEIEDEFMFGSHILVAPIVVKKEEREIYLPKGHWYDFWADKPFYSYGEEKKIEASLDIMPIYLRNGAIIPMQEPIHYVGEKEIEELEVLIFAEGDVKSEQVIYEDDGVSYDYEKGVYNEKLITLEGKNKITMKNLHWGYKSSVKNIKFVLLARDKPSKIIFNGEEVAFEYDYDKRKVIFKVPY